jgi:hypothetical protein
MRHSNDTHWAGWLGIVAAAALAACGGGGGGGSSSGSAGASAVTITGKAVDGPLQGAVACYDLNDNGVCETGEPTSIPTDSTGAFSFSVAGADAGKHRVVVEVPPTAVDADTGLAVGTGFTLQSPATGTSGAQNVFASPLTTLVQAHVDATGTTLTAATEFVKTQAGLAVSPLADFTASSNADNAAASKVARLVQITTLRQNEAVAAVVGTPDLSLNTITSADLAKAVTQAVVAALPTVAALARDPAVASASGTALQQALETAAQTVVRQTGLTSDTVVGQITANKAPADATPTTAPEPGASLAALRYTNSNNWYYRSFESTAADNTPDSNGKVSYYEVRQQSDSSGFSPNGVARSWAYGGSLARRGDLHWNGSAWVGCPLGTRYNQTLRDAQGRGSYDYCDGFESGAGVRTAVDVAGKSIATLFTDVIRKYPGGAGGVAYANWGPADPATAFGSATFPTGAKLFYQTNTPTATALTYDVQATAVVTAYSADVAAGGDARTSAPSCSVGANQVASGVATLEDLVARNPGQPCVFGKNVLGTDISLDPNEWWGNSTASLGTVIGGATRPDGTGNWYSANLPLRVAFAPTGNATTYYSCLARATNGSPRNCTAIGTGTYSIQTLGDARVLTLAGVSVDVQKMLGYDRVFVERGGKIYYGFKSPVGIPSNQVRLNLLAANAVLALLPGMPKIDPVRRAADLDPASTAALATAKGVFSQNDATTGLFFRFGDGGTFLMAQAKPDDLAALDVSGLELGAVDYTASTGTLKSQLELDTNLTAGTSHPGGSGPITGVSFSSTGMTIPGGAILPRASSPANGIVGVWALSPTDLKVQHFVFYPNGKVLLIDPLGDTSGGACTTANQGPPGVEYASYTYDATTGALRVFDKLYDTNGCAGFFDSSAGAVAGGTANAEANFTLTISVDGMTATGDKTVYRIAP